MLPCCCCPGVRAFVSQRIYRGNSVYGSDTLKQLDIFTYYSPNFKRFGRLVSRLYGSSLSHLLPPISQTSFSEAVVGYLRRPSKYRFMFFYRKDVLHVTIYSDDLQGRDGRRKPSPGPAIGKTPIFPFVSREPLQISPEAVILIPCGRWFPVYLRNRQFVASYVKILVRSSCVFLSFERHLRETMSKLRY